MHHAGYDSFEVAGFATSHMDAMIEAIGDDDFYGRLLAYLDENVGAQHCAILAFESDHPTKVGAVSLDGTDLAAQQIDLYLARYWRHDPTIMAAHKMAERPTSSLLRLDPARLPPSGLRDLVYRKAHISDRLLLCGGGRGAGLSVSIVRSDDRGKFTDREIGRLAGVASTLLAIIGKHAKLVTKQSELSLALSSVDIISQTMLEAPEGMPRREVEVCARILFGVSSLGIGLDLDIGEETVKTYRKRAYQRLGIATQRELLMWYIRLWGALASRRH